MKIALKSLHINLTADETIAIMAVDGLGNVEFHKPLPAHLVEAIERHYETIAREWALKANN